jgi:hypothetical protein
MSFRNPYIETPENSLSGSESRRPDKELAGYREGNGAQGPKRFSITCGRPVRLVQLSLPCVALEGVGTLVNILVHFRYPLRPRRISQWQEGWTSLSLCWRLFKGICYVQGQLMIGFRSEYPAAGIGDHVGLHHAIMG